MNIKPVIYALLLIAMVAAASYFFHSCKSETAVSKVEMPAETERKKEANVDSIKSYYENLYRQKLADSTKKILARQNKSKIEYRYIKVKDDQLEKDYWNGKASADSVIISKNNRILKVETLASRCDSLRGIDSLKVASLTGSLAQKDSVNKNLNTGWKKANEATEMERKKRFGIGFQVGGTFINGQPSPYLGAGFSWNVFKF